LLRGSLIRLLHPQNSFACSSSQLKAHIPHQKLDAARSTAFPDNLSAFLKYAFYRYLVLITGYNNFVQSG
jgi:hypothetical protein